MAGRLRVALVGGPMYDTLYDELRDDVEIVVHADHLTLNAQVAELLAAGERIDVLSTHGKYAPSQRQWLHPLDELLDPAIVADLDPAAVDLCRDRGVLLCVPRNVDVRVLWWRDDRLPLPPATWDDVLRADTVFGFTGRGSGLFGMFFELVVGRGGQLFDDAGAPALDPSLAGEATRTIVELGRRLPEGPSGLTSWHYDEVDAALGSGLLDCAAAWPGGTAALRASAAGPHLRPAPYPAGEARHVSYSGCHGWAIPTTCGDLDGAVALLERLCSAELQRVEASVGGVPARTEVLRSIEPVDEIDEERLDVVRATVARSMITYPSLDRFPKLEDAGSAALTSVLAGAASPDYAVAVIQRALAAATNPC
jgi:multiple sugar transport system substrate-binding protein